MINTILKGLEDSSWAVTLRQSAWLYPIVEIVHISGIALLVGPAFMFDLRLLGFSKNIPVTELGQHLLPWSRRSLFLIVPSGLLLFITNAYALWYNPVFRIKMLLLVIAGINALCFHYFTFRAIIASNEGSGTPTAAKVSAGISIIAWLTLIACGRLLAYS